MHVILTITQKFLSCRRRLADCFLTVVIEKHKTLKVPDRCRWSYISTRYLTPLLNSRQTDANKKTRYYRIYSFTAIFLWFEGLKTKHLYFSSFLIVVTITVLLSYDVIHAKENSFSVILFIIYTRKRFFFRMNHIM